MKKAIFIYNPLSGGRSIPHKLDKIVQKFQEHDVLLQPYRLYVKEIDSLALILKEGVYDYLIGSGGDGTLNAVAELLLKNGINLPMGIVPSGTSNDFARSLGIPLNLNESLDIILRGRTIDVDVGRVNGEKYFLSTCAGGAFVDVSFSTHADLKKNLGPLAYYLRALTEVKNIKPFKLSIHTGMEVFNEEALIFLILNGKYGAGFYNLSEKADVSDGIMDIIVIRQCSNIDLVALVLKAIKNELAEDKSILKIRTASCRIEGAEDIPLSVDGEKGMNLPINVEFINKALRVFVR